MTNQNKQRPDMLILDVGSAIQDFRNTIGVFPMREEITDNHLIALIFEYIVGLDYAKSNILEMLETMREIFEGNQPADHIEEYCRALQILSKRIVQRLLELKAFEDGIFWYEFKTFCLNDVVLYRVTKEDLIN